MQWNLINTNMNQYKIWVGHGLSKNGVCPKMPGFCINYHVFRWYIHFALLFSLKKCHTCIILYILVILFYKNAPKAPNLPSGAKAQAGAFPTWWSLGPTSWPHNPQGYETQLKITHGACAYSTFSVYPNTLFLLCLSVYLFFDYLVHMLLCPDCQNKDSGTKMSVAWSTGRFSKHLWIYLPYPAMFPGFPLPTAPNKLRAAKILQDSSPSWLCLKPQLCTLPAPENMPSHHAMDSTGWWNCRTGSHL